MASLQFILFMTVYAMWVSSARAKSESDTPTKWPTELKQFLKFYQNIGNKSEDNADLLIKSDGYPVEIHSLTTKDGYKLTCLRIPGGKNNSTATKTPVILSPGFGLTAASWLSYSPKNCLPYLLADRGYDVWMPTYRGNHISSGHVKLTQKDAKYWDFSLDQIGIYDVPAITDLVLKESGKKRLSVVCFSMGCTYFIVALSTNTTYNRKIQKIVVMSPAIYMSHVKVPNWVKRAKSNTSQALPKNNLPGAAEIPHSKDAFSFGTKLCSSYRTWKLCVNSIAQEMTFESSQQSDIALYKLFAITKAKVGWKLMEHMLQFMRIGIFRRFDYGGQKNKIVYGTKNPPKYDLTLVKIPSILTIASPGDGMVVEKDALKFHQELPASTRKLWTVISDPKYTHADFLVYDNNKKLIFDDVINFLGGNI